MGTKRQSDHRLIWGYGNGMLNLTFFNPLCDDYFIFFWLKALNWGCLCLILSQCFCCETIWYKIWTTGAYIKHMYMVLLWIEWCSCLCSWWIQAKQSTAFSALWLPLKELCMSSLSLSLFSLLLHEIKYWN